MERSETSRGGVSAGVVGLAGADELTAGEQLGELACRCATGVRPVPQGLTGRNDRHAEVAGETDALGAVAGAGFTEQSEPHGTGPPPPE